jgi:hypothetical protein
MHQRPKRTSTTFSWAVFRILYALLIILCFVNILKMNSYRKHLKKSLPGAQTVVVVALFGPLLVLAWGDVGGGDFVRVAYCKYPSH